jgi:hypothetical protein
LRSKTAINGILPISEGHTLKIRNAYEGQNMPNLKLLHAHINAWTKNLGTTMARYVTED